tara:strand:+ start:1414 stop:1845 length:432 start_codon:yes stop_codon:yes gene_type:complete
MKNTLIISLIGLILMSCEKENFEPTTPPNHNLFLEIYSDLEHNGDLYVFDYPDNATNSYFKVSYNSLPTQRVYWSSPDEFYVILFNDTIWTAVVNFSTYSREDGVGHQMVYVNPTLIGDTLNIIGRINEEGQNIYKEILVKIE